MYDPVSPKEMGDEVHASFERMELADPLQLVHFIQSRENWKLFHFYTGLTYPTNKQVNIYYQ